MKGDAKMKDTRKETPELIKTSRITTEEGVPFVGYDSIHTITLNSKIQYVFLELLIGGGL